MSTQPPDPEHDPFRKEPPPSGGTPSGADSLAGMPPLATLGKRLLARLVDLLLIIVPLTLISLPFGGADVSTDNGEDFGDVLSVYNSGQQWAWTVVTAAALVLYDWLMTRTSGQTVGKRLLKLRVAMLADGSTPGSSPALLRAAVLLLPGWLCCPFLWWLIIIVMIGTDKPYKQGLHDKAAKTVVVSTAV